MNRFRVVVVIALCALFAFASIAFAHAKFVKSDPAPDSVLTVAPKQVTIWFAEEMDTKKSLIKVFNAAGAQVDNGDSRVNLNERTQMTVTLKSPLPNGLYTVKWSNVSAADGDPSEGEFKFTVQTPTTPTVAPTNTPTAAPATPTVAPTNAPTAASATPTATPLPLTATPLPATPTSAPPTVAPTPTPTTTHR